MHANNSNITLYGSSKVKSILIIVLCRVSKALHIVSYDLQETEQKYLLKLDGLKLKDVEAGFFHKRVTIALFNPESQSRQ